MYKEPTFNLDINNLQQEQLTTLIAVYREGENHMKYYHSTMHLFKNPQNRVKTHDTVYYESVMPEIEKILIEYGIKK